MTVLTPEALQSLCDRLKGLATLRQHAINTMPPGILEPARAKAVADIGTLTEAAAAIAGLMEGRDKSKPVMKLTDLTWPDGRPKIAPVQGYQQGIPWSLHLKAYNAYCKQHGEQKALIDLEGRGCRGGFGTGELDDFVPGWRDEVEELAQLRAKVTQAEAKLREIEKAWAVYEAQKVFGTETKPYRALAAAIASPDAGEKK